MFKVHSTLRIDDPYYTRDGPIGTKTRSGGFEFTERKQVQAAVAASMETASPHDEGSPASEPMILEGQQVPSGGDLPPPAHRNHMSACWALDRVRGAPKCYPGILARKNRGKNRGK